MGEPPWADGPVHVRVPATSANLGPGFDALGLALDLHDDVVAAVTGAGLTIEIDGEGQDLASAGEKHLVVRAMRETFNRFNGQQPPGLTLRCVNRIPHGRGLGSSAAAIVAGVLAARALCGRKETEHDLALATQLEGHPDNVAACLAGGLTIAWTTSDGPRLIRLDPLGTIAPVICVAPPEVAVRTEVARQALPAMIPHRDAAANSGRTALLIAALTQPDAARALFDATEDRLHQVYRAEAIPDTFALVTSLREARIPAVVSGAGPSVLALLPAAFNPDSSQHLDSLGSIVRETGKAWHISPLDVARQGARLLGPDGGGFPWDRYPLSLRDTDGCEGMP